MSKDKIRPLITAIADLPVHHTGLALGVVKELSGQNQAVVAKAIQNALASLAGAVAPEPILRLISSGADIVIPPCDGRRFIARAKSIFQASIDTDFKNWKLAQAGPATEATNAAVYEMAKEATFVRMFGSLCPDLDQLCFTQDQIIAFCECSRTSLRAGGHATFFLFKENEQYFVAIVRVHSGLVVDVHHLGRDSLWSARHTHRVVVPQLAI